MLSLGEVWVVLGLRNELSAGLKATSAQMKEFAANAAMAGASLSASLTAPIVGLGTAALGAAASFEQTQTAFKNLLGSADAANAMLKEMEDFAAKTPFQFDELTGAALKMKAFGFEVQQILPALHAVGDASAALGGGAERINRIMLALGQMRMKGKVSGEEMRQLAESNIGAWQYLAEAMGKSTAEVQKLASKGAIDANAAIATIIQGMGKQFAGMMEDQSKTMLGKWSTVKDQLSFMMKDIGTALLPVAKMIVDGLNTAIPYVQKLTAAFAELTPTTKMIVVGIAALLAGIGPLLLAFAGISVGIASIVAAGPVLLPLLGAIGLAITGIVAAWYALGGNFTDVTMNILAGLGLLNDGLATTKKNFVDLALGMEQASVLAKMLWDIMKNPLDMQNIMAAAQGRLEVLETAAKMVKRDIDKDTLENAKDLQKLATTLLGGGGGGGGKAAAEPDWLKRLKDAFSGAGELLGGMKKTKAELEKAAKAAEQAEIEMMKLDVTQQNMVQSWYDSAKGAEDFGSSMAGLEAQLAGLDQLFNVIGPGILSVSEQFNALTESLDSVGGVAGLSDQQLENYVAELERLMDAGKLTDEQLAKLGDAYTEQLQRGMLPQTSAVTKATFNWSAALQGVALFAGMLNDKLGDTINIVGNVAQQFANAKTKEEKFTAIASGVGQIGGLIGGKTGGALQGAASGAMMGATIGSIIPGIGTVVGGVIGGVAGAVTGMFKSAKLQKAGKEAGAILGRTVSDAQAKAMMDQAKSMGITVKELAEQMRKEEVAAAKKQREEIVTQGLEKAAAGVKVWSGKLQGAAAEQGRIYAATFAAMVAENGILAAADAFKDNLEAIAAISPQLAADIRAFSEPGPLRDAAEAAKGLADTLVGLTAAGYMNTSLFADFGATAKAAYDQALAGGAAQQQALLAVAPLLAQMKAASDQYGFTLDANTQGLIDQAEAAGIAFKPDPMLQMLEVLKAIAEVLGAELPAAARAAGDAIEAIPTPDIPQMPRGEGGEPYPQPEEFGGGSRGWRQFGRRGTLAVLHDTEAVVRPGDEAPPGLKSSPNVVSTVNLTIQENPLQTAEMVEQMRRFTLEAVERQMARQLSVAIEEGNA